MKQVKRKGLDHKSEFKKPISVTLPCRFSNSMTLMLHTELVCGEHEKNKFRLIQDVGNRGFRLEYKDYHVDFDTKDLVTVMMNKILEEIKPLTHPQRGKKI